MLQHTLPASANGASKTPNPSHYWKQKSLAPKGVGFTSELGGRVSATSTTHKWCWTRRWHEIKEFHAKTWHLQLQYHHSSQANTIICRLMDFWIPLAAGYIITIMSSFCRNRIHANVEPSILKRIVGLKFWALNTQFHSNQLFFALAQSPNCPFLCHITWKQYSSKP